MKLADTPVGFVFQLIQGISDIPEGWYLKVDVQPGDSMSKIDTNVCWVLSLDTSIVAPLSGDTEVFVVQPYKR
jgi:hypothetical protein